MKLYIFFIALFIFTSSQAFSQNQDSIKAYNFALQAVKFMGQGNYDTAIELIDRSIALDPNNITYPYEKSVCYYKQSKYSEAISILEPIIESDSPQLGEQMFQLLGACYDFSSKKDKAIKVLEKGLSKFPNSARLHLELGITEVGNERIEKATMHWLRGIEVDPLFPTNYFHLAKVYYEQKQYFWSILYGETFLNISNSPEKAKEISMIIYNAYKEALNIENGKWKINLVDKKEKYYNEANLDNWVEALYNKVLAKSKAKKNDTINISKLLKIRTDFFSEWQKSDKKFIYPTFDFNVQIIKAGYYDAYNMVIFSEGNPQEYNAWKDKNKEKLSQYLAWQSKNLLDMRP